MRFLFFFAHPDDESAGPGATLATLAKMGHEVKIICATNGSAGEITPQCQDKAIQAGSLGNLRTEEFHTACAVLGVTGKLLDFGDGYITNCQTWTTLTQAFSQEIESKKPDVVITF